MATPTTGTIPCPQPASFFTRRRWVPETAALRTIWLSVGPNATGLSRFPRISARRVGSFAVRAESCPDSYYVPDAKFYKVEAIVRPWRISQISAAKKLLKGKSPLVSYKCTISTALLKIGIRGVTVSDVKGFGAQGGSTERQGGSEFSEDKFVAKIKMEIVVSKDQVEAVIEKIIDEARTGEIGDGKIFLTPVADIIRIRTGERGEEAERMMGGRSDVMASNN